MRVLLSTYDSRWGVEPLAGLAVRLRELGAEVRVCAPPDCAEQLAEVGVPLVPVGAPVRPLVHEARPPSAADVPYCPIVLPSPHHPPPPLPGRPYPPEVTDNRVLNDLNAQSFNALFGAALNTHRASERPLPAELVDDDRLPGRRAAGGGSPVGGPAILGRPGGRPGHRRGTRRPGSDHRVPVSRAQQGPDPRDPRTSGRRGRH